MRQGNRVIGAGIFYWKPKGGSDWIEIGETQGGSINTSVERKETWDKSSSLKKVIDMQPTSVNATIKFDTRRLNRQNLELYMLGTSEDVTYEVGDELPDGTTATAQVVVTKISAGKDPMKKGAIRFVGDEDGDERPVTVCDDVVLIPSGDRELLGDDYAGLSFEGISLADSDGAVYNEYLIPVS